VTRRWSKLALAIALALAVASALGARTLLRVFDPQVAVTEAGVEPLDPWGRPWVFIPRGWPFQGKVALVATAWGLLALTLAADRFARRDEEVDAAASSVAPA
jgi:hypothetical protein